MAKAKPIPDGFHSVTPFLVAKGIPKLIEFLQKAFNGKEVERCAGPDGMVLHAEVKIGDSIVMMGEARGGCEAMPCSVYLYVPNVDETYKQALRAGGKSEMEPVDMFYGDRSGAVKDPAGNTWWIATHVEDVPREEIERRAQARAKEAAHA